MVLACGCGGGPEVTVFSGDIILVTVDSLRADHLGAYGYEHETSPFLDRLAADGAVFERAWAPSSYTSQSVAAILTGRLPTSAGAIGLLEAEPAETADRLARHLAAAGRRSGIVSNQSLLRGRGFTRGFADIQIAGERDDWTAAEVTRRGLGVVDDAGDGALFLHLHYADPHQPYNPPVDLRDNIRSLRRKGYTFSGKVLLNPAQISVL